VFSLTAPRNRNISFNESPSTGQNATSAVNDPGSIALSLLTGNFVAGGAAKLYRVGHLFACQHCLGLAYASQQEIPVRRAIRRAQKIKMKLGGSDDPLEPLPQKPRGMHWRTYERLRAQADAADAEADALLVESMPGLKELLADSGVADPAPPRPKRQRRRRDGGQ
jgi:hypothetical protein